jgi:hypothetical protein
MLLFSSHNHANLPYLDTSLGSVWRGALRSPRDLARAVYHSRSVTQRLRNRRAARAFERANTDHAVINDPVHDHRLAHYFIERDAQERQLADAGYELVEALDADGQTVAPGATAERSACLHYVARWRSAA